MPSLADYLQSQDSLNGQAAAMMPAVAPQIAPDLAQRSAQAIMATVPQQTRQAQSAAMGGLTPSSMRSMMAPRGGMQQANLDFSPVSSWSEGLSGGVGNAMAMLQANRANQAQQAQQQQIMDFYREQQAAALQQEQAKQQAEQAKLIGQAQVAQKLVPNLSLEEAIGFVQSPEGAKIFGAYQPLADQVVSGQQKDIYAQQALEIMPNVGQAGQPTPISPLQQQQMNIIGGAPSAAFNQYTPQVNMVESQAKVADLKEKQRAYGQAVQEQPIEVGKKKADLQGAYIKNALDKFNLENAPIKAEIEQLKAQGELDAAARKESDYNSMMTLVNSLTDADFGNPARMRAVNFQLNALGFKGTLPETSNKVQTVGSGATMMVVAPNGQLVSPQDYNRIIQQPAVTVPQQQPQRTAPVTVKAPVKPANKTTKTSKGIVVTSPTGQSITFGNNPKNW